MEDFNGKKVILNLGTYMPYILNYTASEVWDFCRRPRNTKDIAAFLSKRYNVSMPVLKKDVRILIKDLKAGGLIEEADVCPSRAK